jgi:alpha-mannosidase
MTHGMRWTVAKITQRLDLIEPLVYRGSVPLLIYRRRAPLPPFRYLALPGPATPPLVAAEVDDQAWPVIAPDTYWGRPDTNFMLRSTFQIPSDWEIGRELALYLPLGDARDFSHPEALVYVDGKPYIACDRNHWEIRLRPEWQDGRRHTLALHGWTGLSGNANTDPVTRLVMRPCEIVQIDSPARDFVTHARVTLGVAKALDPNAPARGTLLNALDEAFKILDLREPFGDSFYASLAPAHAALRAGIAQAGPALPVRLAATGHAHIDVAWLWTLDQTRRKAGRTFHTVLRLMEQFPDFHFTQSQPQLYEYLRTDYPELFETLTARVAEGRWEPIGGMWVEADCNISGAESLARQFLLGRTFFRQHFGPEAESRVLWLPDVFGYAWALPQLIKQAGLDYFFTIKLSWNQYNRLPYDSFWWQGLDGTRVLTHFSTTSESDGRPVSTYNAPARPEDVLRTWENLQQKELHSEVFMAFGYGDGGGGPTREMLENLQALAAFPAMPQARQRPASDFFRDLEQTAGPRLPVWNGELYLELHRGTYTTQSRSKRANRQSEFRLHDAEFLAAFAAQIDPAYTYPSEIFTQAWRLVCLNQFHDILPGSSIGAVYAESLAQYAEVTRLASAVRASALAALSNYVAGDFMLINPTSFARRDLAFYPAQLPSGAYPALADGTRVLAQVSDNGTWIDAGELPPFSLTPLFFSGKGQAAPSRPLTASPAHLENDYLRVELNAAGDLSRIYDKTQAREVLPAGAVANQFQAFEDRPKEWEAWDVDIFYDDKQWLAESADSIRVVEAGPLRATLEIRRRILHSTYTQRLSLAHNSPRLDIETVIDWRERHILLKAAFPVDILSPVATYEIQWGNVQRPTHRNTSWDWARFETCAQKWVDLSEGGYGVSLLNDCKYGHDVQGNVLRLSLLRSPTYPDPEADQGEQRFIYSLLPHAGGWGSGTIAAAYALNDPILAAATTGQSATERQPAEEPALPRALPAFLQCDASNVVIETVKQAEDGQGVIVRLYESQRQRGEITLSAGFALAAVNRTNLLEENQAALAPRANRVTLFIKPYEIVTLRLIPA